MMLIAGEHGYWPLTDVRPFHAEWERAASLRLRAGDQDVLTEYDTRGRLHEAPGNPATGSVTG